MNIYDSSFIKWVASSGWYSKQLPKLTRSGKTYVENLLNHCPCKNEQEFNNWIFGAGQKYKLSSDSKKDAAQMNMVTEWYTCWLNNTYRESKNA